MKRIAILPTLLTLGNAVCGFSAIVVASKIQPEGSSEAELAAWFFASGGLILLAMLFDALDGFAARLTKSASDFGAQLDSLCDALSFGAAPAFLLLKLTQDWDKPMFRNIVGGVAALYMICALLRLARFNIENAPDPNAHKRFKGLPSPAAAGCVASLAILRSELPLHALPGLDGFFVRQCLVGFAPLGTLAVALLMVSRLSYPHFVNQLVRRRRSFSVIVQVVFAVCFLWIMQTMAPFLLFWTYALIAPVRYGLRVLHGGVAVQVLPVPTESGPHLS